MLLRRAQLYSKQSGLCVAFTKDKNHRKDSDRFTKNVQTLNAIRNSGTIPRWDKKSWVHSSRKSPLLTKWSQQKIWLDALITLNDRSLSKAWIQAKCLWLNEEDLFPSSDLMMQESGSWKKSVGYFYVATTRAMDKLVVSPRPDQIYRFGRALNWLKRVKRGEMLEEVEAKCIKVTTDEPPEHIAGRISKRGTSGGFGIRWYKKTDSQSIRSRISSPRRVLNLSLLIRTRLQRAQLVEHPKFWFSGKVQ